jgi:Metallo-beta-lactamase superfamily domain
MDHIYCTQPVQHLGHLALYELLATRHDISDFHAFTYDDIDIAFEAIKGARFVPAVHYLRSRCRPVQDSPCHLSAL